MRVIDADEWRASSPRVVAIGVFDGLHRGHQQVLVEVRALTGASDAAATVVTFDPHPATVLDPPHAPRLIGTIGQRIEGMARLGVDQVRVVRFDHTLASESAEEFIERVLVAQLRVRDVVVGEDFRFGHERRGDVALLRSYGERHGYAVHPARIEGDEERWSSTAVRAALARGDLARANRVLGRPFTLRGAVVHGDARGATLGFATANLEPEARQQLPARGVYAGAAHTPDGDWWPAAVSVGTRPQFYDAGDLRVEAHLVGYHGDLYDQVLDLSFLSALRPETTFDGVDALVAQMERDVAATVAAFATFTPGSFALLG